VSELIDRNQAARQAPLLLDAGHPLPDGAAIVLAFEFAGQQSLHNTALWQHFRPVTLVSPPQTGTPVEVIDTRRVAHVVVQTEKGLYFLTGAKYVPPKRDRNWWCRPTNAGTSYLCAADGSRCMSIHSFCAEMVWPNAAARRSGAHRSLLCAARARHAAAGTLQDQAADGGARRHGQAQAPTARHGHVPSARMGLAHGSADSFTR
jgi:hypothetical protein